MNNSPRQPDAPVNITERATCAHLSFSRVHRSVHNVIFRNCRRANFATRRRQRPVAIVATRMDGGTYILCYSRWKVKRAAVRPRCEFHATVMRHLACRPAGPSPRTITRDIIYIDARHRFAIPFLPSRRVTVAPAVSSPRPSSLPGARSRRDPIRGAGRGGGVGEHFFCKASFAQNLVSIPSRKRRRSPIIEWRAAKAA